LFSEPTGAHYSDPEYAPQGRYEESAGVSNTGSLK